MVNDDGENTTGDGLSPRKSVAAAMDPRGDGSGFRPFWDYEQETLDASTVKWTVETNVDGSLSTLYVQAPYGYQGDLLQADKSVILTRIADAMRNEGHDDWADTITADKIWTLDWRTGACQTIGFSYKKGKPLDVNKLKALASYDPYDIQVFNEDLLKNPAVDEMPPSKFESNSVTMGFMGLGTTIISGLAALTGPVAVTVSIASFIYSVVMFGIGIKAFKKRTQGPLRRPGFLLETTSGWLVWQYDSSSHSTPRRLVESATRQVNDWIDSKYEYDKPLVTEVATSADGRMTWFRSDRRLDVECELSPYQAEQYLSLFVKHQSNPNKTRSYLLNEPTIIMSTVTEAASPDPVNVLEEPKSAWTAGEAVKRANKRLDAVDDHVVNDGALTDDAIIADQSMRLEAMARDLISKAMTKNDPVSVNTVRKAGTILTMLKNSSNPGDLARIETELVKASKELETASIDSTELAAAAGLKAMNVSITPSDHDSTSAVSDNEHDSTSDEHAVEDNDHTGGGITPSEDSTNSESLITSTVEAKSNPFLRNRI